MNRAEYNNSSRQESFFEPKLQKLFRQLLDLLLAISTASAIHNLGYPTSGFLLSIDTEENLEALPKCLGNSAGVFLSRPFLLGSKPAIVIPSIRKLVAKKLIIADTRLEQEPDERYDDLSTILNGVDAMTALSVYGKDFLQKLIREANLNVYAIIDVGSSGFAKNFGNGHVVSFAKTAKDCLCRGVIMTPRYPARIRKVRAVVGKQFEIISSWHPSSKPGDGVSAGANLEVLKSDVWTKIGGDEQLTKLKKMLSSKSGRSISHDS